MVKHISVLLILLLAQTGMAMTASKEQAPVELRLVADLDEPRGYCLDVAGGQGKSAPIERGLQAHTCYDYKGVILEDQGFDAVLFESGQFKLSYFDVCMTVDAIQAGEAIMLAACDGSEKQQFSLNTTGQIIAKNDSKLCVTVNPDQKKSGRGGEPVHVMRPVSLEMCADAHNSHQQWTIFSL